MPVTSSLPHRLVAEALGTLLLVATVLGAAAAVVVMRRLTRGAP